MINNKGWMGSCLPIRKVLSTCTISESRSNKKMQIYFVVSTHKSCIKQVNVLHLADWCRVYEQHCNVCSCRDNIITIIKTRDPKQFVNWLCYIIVNNDITAHFYIKTQWLHFHNAPTSISSSSSSSPRQNGSKITDNEFKCSFVDENRLFRYFFNWSLFLKVWLMCHHLA